MQSYTNSLNETYSFDLAVFMLKFQVRKYGKSREFDFINKYLQARKTFKRIFTTSIFNNDFLVEITEVVVA